MLTRYFSSVLFSIGFIEFFERFGFYSLQGILVLFLLKEKHFSSTDAFHIFGAFMALLYCFVGLGGWCGEKVLGPKKTLVLGLIVIFMGYVALAIWPESGFFPALSAVCIGNAMFKANPAAIIGKIYQGDNSRLHSAFTIFYMTVNLGALLALMVSPNLAKWFGYSYAFAASALGIFIALVYIFLNQQKLEDMTKNLDFVEPKFWYYFPVVAVVFLLWILTTYLLSSYEYVRLGLKFIIAVILVIYISLSIQKKCAERNRLFAVLILMVEAVIFFTLYHQMATSINLYAVLHVYPEVWGLRFDPQSYQALNPFWIVIWSPLLARFYQQDAGTQKPLSIYFKFALGMLCCGISYLILFVSHYFVNAQLQVSPIWLVLSYIFQSLAELLVSALGLAMVAELVPVSWMGAVMGMWFLTSAVSGFTGAAVASLITIPKNIQASMDTLHQFSNLFAEIALVILGISILMFLSVKFLEKMTK
jgi:POT family proton-dependent oligopeptide transporter